MNLKRPAFTMIELVMVIVVLGVLAALAMPRMERDLRQEAGDNILSAIRYTQHLALTDNKTNPDSLNWQRAFWQIRFSNPGGEWLYSIGSNRDLGNNLDQNESAVEMNSGKFLHSANASPADDDESPDIFLTNKYGINSVVLNACAGTAGLTPNHIAFDYLGRPHRGVTQGASNNFRTLIHSNSPDCTITFGFADGSTNLVINILRETGYAFIQGQPNS